MKRYRLDKSIFSIKTFDEATSNRSYWMSKSPAERLSAAWYLICCAYNLDPNKEHRLDRTLFSKRKRG